MKLNIPNTPQFQVGNQQSVMLQQLSASFAQGEIDQATYQRLYTEITSAPQTVNTNTNNNDTGKWNQHNQQYSQLQNATPPVGILGWYRVAWKKCTEFHGRARRKEFWTFNLINFFISFISFIILFVIPAFLETDTHNDAEGMIVGFLRLVWLIFVIEAIIFAIVAILISIGVVVRRLHDIGRSGWWLLLILILLLVGIVIMSESPIGVLLVIIGLLALLEIPLKNSQPGINKWGPNPKNIP
jgi:uncharacterized membrane protein YhaH (DUF805 family)